jgi:hypothetical protein
MATKTVVCPECDSPLAPGRFSCSVCGALVASVATVSRSFAPVAEQMAYSVAAEAAPPAEPPEPAPPVPNVAPPAATAPSPVRKPRLPSAPSRRPKATPAADATNGSNGSAPAGPPAMPVAPPEPMSWVLAEPARPEPARPEPARVELAGDMPPQVSASHSPVPAVLAAVPAVGAPAAVPTWPDRPVWPPVRNIDAVAAPVEPPAPRVPAGAYLPPSAVLPPAEALPLPGTARPDAAATGKGDGWASVSSDWRGRLGDAGSLGLPADLPTRVVMLGAGLALLGFLMPWADIVIGSGLMDGYVAKWGLAGPGHPMVLVLVASLFGLALIADRLPRWVRLGLPSIGLAGLLIGLAWPYLVGPFDASVGVYVVAVGAILMIAGGLLDRIMSRHVEPATSV